MPLALDEPPPAAAPAGGPWIDLLARIAEENGSLRVAGELLPVPPGCPGATTALTGALLARYVRSSPASQAVRQPGGRCAR
jgi:hypothetical protein